MNKSQETAVFYQFNMALLCVVNAFFTFAGTFSNCVVIFSLLNRQLRRKLCYFMILILAWFDLAVVLVLHPLIFVEIIEKWLFLNRVYSIEVYHVEHLFVFSLTALLTMTTERYLALVYPFFHHKYVTRSRLVIVLALLQLPFGLPYFALLHENSEIALWYVELCFPPFIGSVFLVMVYLNWKLLRVVKKLRKQTVIPLGIINVSEQKSYMRTVKIKKPKLTLGKISTCSVAVGCLFVSYCPSIIFSGIELKDKHYWSAKTMRVVRLWVDTLLTMNSTLNSVIFFYNNGTLRRQGKKILKKYFQRGI